MKTKNTIYLAIVFTIGILTIFSCSKDDDCTKQTWYQDADGDGFGNKNQSQQSCYQPTGYVSDNTDCDDTNVSIYPGAPENTTDGIDNNCNGTVDECTGVLTTKECDCTDGIDNDADGLTDAADPDC